MNLRNALCTLLLLGLSLTLAAGQRTRLATDSPAQVSRAGAVASPDLGNGKPGSLKVFFTGFLLGYYRLPQWQSADFEPTCPRPEEDNRSWKRDLKLGDTDPDSPAKQFIDLLNTGTKDGIQVAQPRNPGDLLVGMGDNFAVALEARAFRRHQDRLWQLTAKSRDLKDWPASPSMSLIGDNVGCFLYQAGYDAVVPGKNDFYFGPERLRRIADRLAAAPVIPGNLDPLRVLAANLVLKTDPVKKPPTILDSDKRDLKFLPGLPSGAKSLDAKDNGTVMPFTRHLRFQLPSGQTPKTSLQHLFLCPVANGQGLDALNPASDDCQKRMRSASDQAWTLEADRPGESDQDSSTTGPGDPVLQTWDFKLPDDWLPQDPSAPGMLFGLCTEGTQKAGDDRKKNPELILSNKQYFCLRLTVAEPLFGSLTDPPYVVKPVPQADGSTAYAVIVGIVDPDLASLVGRDNLSWRNDQPELEPRNTLPPNKISREGKEAYSSEVSALDPATAIAFALRHFDLVGRSAHGIAPGDKIFKVLLAQMERGKAETLAANLAGTRLSGTQLNFDLVLSSATDFSAATADEQVHFDPAPVLDFDTNKSGTSQPRFRQLVVVPWRGYDYSNHRLPDPLRTVTLSDDCPANVCTERNFAIKGRWDLTFPLNAPVDQKVLKSTYGALGQDYLKNHGYWPAPSASHPEGDGPAGYVAFPLAVLDVLRRKTGADVALLQKRDFYWGPFSTPLLNSAPGRPNGVLLDSILWTGDYLQVLTVKGDTLKKVLDDSDKLDAMDAQTSNPAVETDRGLLTWGIQKTRDKQYLVDGTQLDPTRLYTVATSNHISAGDTGYPELADPLFSDARLPRGAQSQDGDVKSQRLSSIICKEFGGDDCLDSPGLAFATIQRLPSQLEPKLSARVNAWGRSFIARPQFLQDSNSLVDYKAQLNPTWRFSLKDLSLNLSGVRNNLSEVQRSTELAAVTEPGAANPKGHAIDYSSHLEFVRSGKQLDQFVRGLALYKTTVTATTQTLTLLPGQTTPPTVEALPVIARSKNQGAIDAGFFLHRKHKYDSRWGLVYEPFHFDTPLYRVELPVNAFYSHTTDQLINPAFTLKLDRDHRFLQRIGFRAESSQSSVELGIEGGWEQNALQELSSNLGDCQALATVTLSSCLKTFQQTPGFLFGSLQQTNGTRGNNGAYVNMDWSIPLIWKLSFRTEDYGEYYSPAHLDNSTDTLYRNDAKETLKFNVLPNLTLGPGLERFDYENKVERVHFRTWSPVFNVTYSFDKYSGGDWKKSLGYSPNAAGAGSK
jgi:hypothetical protein